MDTRKEILNGTICPYCGCKSKLVNSEVVYGINYGYMWLCQPCNAYVGCHEGTKKAKGRLANAELRKSKIAAHGAFDSIWKQRIMKRYNAYTWLAEQLHIPRHLCHIGMFDIEECHKVTSVCVTFMGNR